MTMALPRSVGAAATPRTLRLQWGALARTVVIAVLALGVLGSGLASAVVADRLTRPMEHAHRLWRAAGADAGRLWIVPQEVGASHDRIHAALPAEYETRVIRFFGETLSTTPGGR